MRHDVRKGSQQRFNWICKRKQEEAKEVKGSGEGRSKYAQNLFLAEITQRNKKRLSHNER